MNVHDAFRAIGGGAPSSSSSTSTPNEFLWLSERDGYRHLYAGDLGGSGALRRLTGPGEFVVEDVAAVDEERGVVYYMGTRAGG